MRFKEIINEMPIEWKGTADGAYQSYHTDHTYDEAIEYIKTNYPNHKTYNVYRAEPGFRALFNPRHFQKSLNHTTSVDATIDQLGLQPNGMMTGSKQVSPSIGYSWSVAENPQSGIAVLYYQDRGMGNDQIIVAAKDKKQLIGAVGVFRDAGVLPDAGAMAARKAEKAASRNAMASKKGLTPGRKFKVTDWSGDSVWKILSITNTGKVLAVNMATEEERRFSPGVISKAMLAAGDAQ
jgi:hypothetical protein